MVRIPFILSNKIFKIYHFCLEVHCNCIRYELRLFMAKAFPLHKLIMTSTAEDTMTLVSPGLEPKTSPSRSGCATTITKANVLGFNSLGQTQRYGFLRMYKANK